MDFSIMTTTDYLIELIAAKRNMRASLLEKGVQTWGGLNIYPEAIKRIGKRLFKLADGMKLGYSNFISLEDVEDKVDISTVRDYSNMFSYCPNFNDVFLPSNIIGRDMEICTAMFSCSGVKNANVDVLCETMSLHNMFDHCQNLKTLHIVMYNGYSYYDLCKNCSSLESVIIEFRDCGEDAECQVNFAFSGCINLKSVTFIGEPPGRFLDNYCWEDVPANIGTIYYDSRYKSQYAGTNLNYMNGFIFELSGLNHWEKEVIYV